MSSLAPSLAPSSSVPPSPAPLTAPNRFLGRQPILDAHRRLYGYELLYRAGKENRFSGDPEQATREVIDHWLLLIPEAPRATSFVNCTRSAIVDGLVTLLPPTSTVIEIPENIEPDPAFLSSCLNLKTQGYRFALDGLLPSSNALPFLSLADFIKLDFLSSDYDLRHQVYALAAGSGARLIGEKIENDIQLRIAISEGCTLFQGYFFSQPVVVASHAVPQNYAVYLRLLAELRQDPVHPRKVEKLISADPTLCYRILRIANSALQGHSGVISNIRDALLRVGENALRRMLVVAMAGALSTSRPTALLAMALTRAEFFQLLAPSLSADPGEFYLLGMLSLLDVLLEMPMERVLESIPIPPDMRAALIEDQEDRGIGSQLLSLVRALEACDWAACEKIQNRLGLAEGAIAAHYAQSLRLASARLADDSNP